MELNDGNTTVFLNTRGENDAQVPAELVHFLKYVENPYRSQRNNTKDPFVEMLENRVKAIKQNRDWEAKFMRLEELMKEERAEGVDEGQERVNRLIQILAKENRLDDIIRAASDKAYQASLFEEYNLLNPDTD